jgi:hypothetical protein
MGKLLATLSLLSALLSVNSSYADDVDLDKNIMALHEQVSVNCTSQVSQVFNIDKSYNQSLSNAEKFFRFSRYADNRGEHQRYPLINKSHPQWYEHQNNYFYSVESTKNGLLRFIEKEPSASDILSECIASLDALEKLGKTNILRIASNSIETSIKSSDEFCSVFESDGVIKYAEKIKEFNEYALSPVTNEKVKLIRQKTAMDFNLNLMVMEFLNNGLTINEHEYAFRDSIRSNIIYDEKAYKDWLNSNYQKLSGKVNYSDPNALRKQKTNTNDLNKAMKFVDSFSNDCSNKWRSSRNFLDIIFYFKPKNIDVDDSERKKTLVAALFPGAKEQFNEQSLRKAEFIDNIIKSIENNNELAEKVRVNDLSNPKNCTDYLASKNRSVEEQGLNATAIPTKKLRKVEGTITDLKDNKGLIQGMKIINYKTLQSVNDATGAMFKYNQKTPWFVRKEGLLLNTSNVKVYGIYSNNVTQTYTNGFNRAQSVKIPVIEALCVE